MIATISGIKENPSNQPHIQWEIRKKEKKILACAPVLIVLAHSYSEYFGLKKAEAWIMSDKLHREQVQNQNYNI